MIIAEWDRGDVAYIDGRFVVNPPDDAVTAALLRPVDAIRGEERLEGGVPVNERVIVRVEAGTGEHARNSIRRLPGARVLVDDGEA